MSKLFVKLVSIFAFALVFFVSPENITKSTSSTTTTEKIDYLNLNAAILCKFQPNGHDCDGSGKIHPKFYFDLKLGDCKAFNYGTCPQNLNAYETLSDCHKACRDVGTQTISRNLSVRIFCRLQPDFGYCNEYHPRWYYDLTTRRCKGFSYSGCGGNLNRFITQQLCTATCASVGQGGFE